METLKIFLAGRWCEGRGRKSLARAELAWIGAASARGDPASRQRFDY